MKAALWVTVVRWLIGKLALLALLVVLLLLAPSVWELWGVARSFDPEGLSRQLEKSTSALAVTKETAREEGARKVHALQSRLDGKMRERDEREKERCILPTCVLVKESHLFGLDIEIQLLGEALSFSKAVVKGSLDCGEAKRLSDELEDSRQLVAQLEKSRPRILPRSAEQRRLEEQLRQKEALLTRVKSACAVYEGLPRAVSLPVDFAREAASQKYAELVEFLASGRKAIRTVLVPAIAILLAIILIPSAVKVVTYFGIAPLAVRKFGVKLFPEATGAVTVASAPAALQQIEIPEGEELLVDPALLRSTPDGMRKGTRLLLDWTMPLSSIASRLFLLTSLRTAGQRQTANIAAGEGELDKIAVLELAEGAALVLQPRCLAGVAQSIDRPLRVTRHWRLGSLGSWLTLQLRYLVFHGPVRLIVRGRRGVAVDAVKPNTAVNQAATLGFSANLGYGVSRCETFYGYYSGKQELFNDRFSGGEGHVIHEVHPPRVGGLLLPGRGIEGVINSVLKVFGL